MRKRITCIAMAMLMSLTVFTACGKEKVSEEPQKETNKVAKEEKEEKAPKNMEFPSELTAKKIGSFEHSNFYTSEGGIYYRAENGKYGIMTMDGKKDTGGKYAVCQARGQFFIVMTEEPTESEEIADMNKCGVVDAEGNVLVPEQYASVKVLNERFIRVCEVTGLAESKDDGLVFASENQFAIFASDDDTFFKGNWFVYDVETGKKVEGVSGTKPYNCFAYGNYINYYTDDEKEVYINADGKKLPEDTQMFENGCYIIDNVVYDTNDNKLFSFKENGYVPAYSQSEYFLARKYADEKTMYVYLDASGEKQSAEFTEMPTLEGEMVLLEDGIYNLKGEKVLEGAFTSLNYEGVATSAWIAYNEEKYVMFDVTGKILYEGANDESVDVDSYNFTISKKSDESTYFYSYKDNDFTLKGFSYGPWLVKVQGANLTYNIVDTISGKTIIENYAGYEYAESLDAQLYLYAENSEGSVDVFVIE